MATDRGPADAGLELLNYSFLTDELDHAVEFVTRNFGDHSRVARGRGPLGYRISAAISGRGTSGVAACALPTTLRAVTRSITAHLPLHHGNEYRVGRRTLRSGPDVAVLLCPGHEYTVLTAPGEALVFMLEPSLLEREIEALRMRRPGGWTLRSMSLSLTPANVAILRGLVTRHGAAVAAARLTRRADELWALEDQVAGWLARQVMAADGLVTLSPSNREIVRRIDGWIRQHMSQPITLERLRVAAGVSARTLQEACLAHWSQTPLELVAATRTSGASRSITAGRSANRPPIPLRAPRPRPFPGVGWLGRMGNRCWAGRLSELPRQLRILIPTDVTLAFRILAGLVRRLAWSPESRRPQLWLRAASREVHRGSWAISPRRCSRRGARRPRL